MSNYSTKAALKAGQGTRLTKVSKFMEKTNNVLQTSDLQVVVVESEPRFSAQVKVCHPDGCRKDRQGLCRSEVSGSSSFHEEGLCFSCLFRTNSMRSAGYSSLLMPLEPLAGMAGSSRGQCISGQFTPSCGDSYGRSRWRPLQMETKGPHRSTRCVPLCGGRG